MSQHRPGKPSECAPSTAIDHNSYGTSWFADQYPALAKRHGADFFSSDSFFELIHSYHRIFYENRGVFHQLGYGHAGKVGPEFAPRLEGTGRTKYVADWSLYDRHYGPLFDGSAFANTSRGAKPIPFVYLPINPEWPASFLWWGEPGYEREFVNVVSEMERHFREKGWTATRFEMFFNHKKRYKGFPWDGDEVRFVRDYAYFKEYARFLKEAVPADSPVKFVFRADVSWTMERQFKELAGIINFWVCGGGEFGWYDYASSRGQRLEYFTIGYNSAEGLVSIVAGFIAGSVSLIGFGLDSVIEVASGAALLWRLHHDLSAIQREQVERTTLRVVGGSFVALALYILYESGSTLILQKAPERSIVGLIIAARNGENSVTGR
jgi:hypothetical protein